ncbi:cupin domain-containing protein [Solirubrobacter soli]|uniref:cupin domain-containing protein n=1 Tax=Solirubrobacter soli TaxID=363832 RepID=UPI001B7FBFD5|nr:cupin domain-containing protein [Solirubrobacter soli]
MNDVTGERAVVLRGDEDAPGEPMLVHLHVRPGGAVSGEHLHPAMQERFEVLNGSLATRVDGVERSLREGEAVTVAAGVWHDWWNASGAPVDVLIELTPPSPRFELAIATSFGLANAGRTNAKGVPSLLQVALLGAEFSDVIVRRHPPAFVQRLAFGVLGFVARRRGLQAIYPEYLGPHGSVEPEPDALAAAGLSPISR